MAYAKFNPCSPCCEPAVPPMVCYKEVEVSVILPASISKGLSLQVWTDSFAYFRNIGVENPNPSQNTAADYWHWTSEPVTGQPTKVLHKIIGRFIPSPTEIHMIMPYIRYQSDIESASSINSQLSNKIVRIKNIGTSYWTLTEQIVNAANYEDIILIVQNWFTVNPTGTYSANNGMSLLDVTISGNPDPQPNQHLYKIVCSPCCPINTLPANLYFTLSDFDMMGTACGDFIRETTLQEITYQVPYDSINNYYVKYMNVGDVYNLGVDSTVIFFLQCNSTWLAQLSIFPHKYPVNSQYSILWHATPFPVVCQPFYFQQTLFNNTVQGCHFKLTVTE
jgi:hypothetical protein